MGFVPPRLIRPRATPDLSLLEGVKAYAPVEMLSGGQSNRATLALLKRVEREIERMEAAGLTPLEMYEEPPTTPSEMLIEYDYELTRWAEWMRKDAFGCPFYRPETRHNG